MGVELSTLFLIGFAYLSLLFAIAWLTDRNVIPAALASHPAVYTLSLGVCAGGWAFFGMTGIASRYGYAYLAYFAGLGALFLFAPLLLLPLLRICRHLQLTSLADVLAYRYRGARVGAVVTLGILLAALPLVAVQIRIVSDVAAMMSDSSPATAAHSQLGLVFALAIAVFAILFGARPISERERHNGLVVTMAFETLVKLAAFTLIGLVALTGVFDGPVELERWLLEQPGLLDTMQGTVRSGSGHMLTLTFLAAAMGLPHLFHMALYENPSTRAVTIASWGFPLLLLTLSLPILPVLWAGTRLELPADIEYYGAALGIARGSPLLILSAFLGGLSAASSTIIVITLALASMSMNNFILPFYRLGSGRDLYRGLVVIRSILIALFILLAQFFSVALAGRGSLEALGFSAFIAAAQFFPGTLALLYWPRANRSGFLWGLFFGFAIWFLVVLAQLNGWPAETVDAYLPVTIAGNHWASAAISSLTLNSLALVLASWLLPQRAEEREAAAACSLDNLSRRSRHQLQQRSPAQFVAALTPALGRDGAEHEVARALRDLDYDVSENRPYAMRRLRERIEANLSRLMGSPVAMDVVAGSLPFEPQEDGFTAEDIHFVETRIEAHRRDLTGFAAELDALRRFYRNTLQALPVGVCGINNSGEIVMWNQAIEGITGIEASAVLGSSLDSLSEPWGQMIRDFADAPSRAHFHQQVAVGSETLWISLHKTLADAQPASGPDARFLLVEDVTDVQVLQDELFHSERLASIGRLAAGVAHEIGNPVAGIDGLAQNMIAETAEDQVRDSARQVLKLTHRIGNILGTLVNFAHSGVGTNVHPERLALRQCVEEACYLLSLDRDAPPVDFRNHCDASVYVHGDGQKLLQVFVNLLSNARDASEPGGKIDVSAATMDSEVLISVTDRGCGIPSSRLDKVFEPFFTTKAPGAGTGLGLALVYSIVKDMHGWISVDSPVDAGHGTGTRVSIRLPLGAAPANIRSDAG